MSSLSQSDQVTKVGAATPFVSIIMPALNEEQFIEGAINSITPKGGKIDYELLVIDGGSTDRTRPIVMAMSKRDERIRLIANHKRIQAAGVNIGVALADPRAQVIVRADCHVRYPEGFVERCVQGLTARNVASVVVTMRAEGRTCMQKAIAAAQNSRLGNGGAQHRSSARSGFVDHGHHAAFDRNVFLELGGYDEAFSHNEDAEFDKRLTLSGRRIYLDSDAALEYFPRSNLRELAWQYFSYGRGRARTVLKHRALPRVRQMLPVAVLMGCILSLPLAALHPSFIAFPIAYFLGSAVWGVTIAARERQPCLALSGVAALVIHMSWAVGFICGLR